MKQKKLRKCINCGHSSDRVKVQGSRLLCPPCAGSMPGIYVIGGSAEHSLTGDLMRKICFCTNLIIDEIRAEKVTKKEVKKRGR